MISQHIGSKPPPPPVMYVKITEHCAKILFTESKTPWHKIHVMIYLELKMIGSKMQVQGIVKDGNVCTSQENLVHIFPIVFYISKYLHQKER